MVQPVKPVVLGTLVLLSHHSIHESYFGVRVLDWWGIGESSAKRLVVFLRQKKVVSEA